jgi:DNA polymerase
MKVADMIGEAVERKMSLAYHQVCRHVTDPTGRPARLQVMTRTADLFETDSGRPEMPASLDAARRKADTCTRCPLYKHATQTVLGEGPARAPLMLVGEQPGDQEDLQGRPFVGPAGKVLDRAMEEAGMERDQVFITNAVKHFKFESRGKKRLHKRPNNYEIDVCRWWIDLERLFVKPKVVVALGATALRGITGRSVSITSMRGSARPLEGGTLLVATIHPSYLLRMPDRDAASSEYDRFVADLGLALRTARA